jgi:hypothetical protein
MILTKRQDKYPFFMNKTFLDYWSGYPVFNAHYYEGKVTCNNALFETWIDANGERNWKCINPNFKYFLEPVYITI